MSPVRPSLCSRVSEGEGGKGGRRSEGSLLEKKFPLSSLSPFFSPYLVNLPTLDVFPAFLALFRVPSVPPSLL